MCCLSSSVAVGFAAGALCVLSMRYVHCYLVRAVDKSGTPFRIC